jgi:hypothetical protein
MLLLAVGLAAATGLVIYAVRRYQADQRKAKVADEGYETAHDILFPQTRHGRRKQHYGPVIPE